MVWPAIIAAGGALLSQHQQARHERRQQRNFVRDRVYDAQMAGISPSLALGAAGYSSTSAPPGAGGALSAIGRVMQEVELEKQEAERDRTQAEANNVRLQNDRLRGEILQERLGRLREATVKNKPTGQAGARLPDVNLSKPERIITPVGSINAPGGYTTNQALQDRYGESADIVGLIQLINDIDMFNSSNLGKSAATVERAVKRRMEQGGRPSVKNPPRKQRPRQLPWD